MRRVILVPQSTPQFQEKRAEEVEWALFRMRRCPQQIGNIFFDHFSNYVYSGSYIETFNRLNFGQQLQVISYLKKQNAVFKNTDSFYRNRYRDCLGDVQINYHFNVLKKKQEQDQQPPFYEVWSAFTQLLHRVRGPRTENRWNTIPEADIKQ